jgi:ribosome-binding protein aMBF1 (putative translation factor)
MNATDDQLLHQDWKTIVLSQKKQDKSKSGKTTKAKHVVKKLDDKLNEKIENGEKHEKFSKEFSQKFIQKRTSLKLKQNQIANRLNVPTKVITDLEKGTLKYDANLNNKIKRIFKI